MNRKISILVLERDQQRVNKFDLNFKGQVLNYRCVKNMSDFYDTLLQRPWTYVFIENDLSNQPLLPADPQSGYNALIVINEEYAYRRDIKQIIVHTNNQIASGAMQEYVYNNQMDNVIFAPYSSPDFRTQLVHIRRETNSQDKY